MFNLEQFMNSAVDPNATSFEVCPEGEFKMMIDSDPKQLDPKEMQGISAKTGNPYHFWQWELNCIVLDEAVKKKLGRERVTVRARVNLDLSDAGMLETGPNKNVTLGQLRDALGQNKPGWKPSDILGAGPFIGRVKHTANKDNPEIKYADVSRFGKVT